MATAETLTDILAKSQQALADTLAGALQGLQIKRAPSVKLAKFCGRPGLPGEQTLLEWLNDLDAYTRQLGIPEHEKVEVALDHLGGPAKDEIKCCPPGDRDTMPKLTTLLKLRFGATESLQSLNNTFYGRVQLEGETLTEFSRSLMQIYDRMQAAAKPSEKEPLRHLRSGSLRGQFIEGARDPYVKRELKRLSHDHENAPFYKFREVVLDYFRDSDPAPPPAAPEWTESSIDAVANARPPASATREILLALVEGQKSLSGAVAETNAQLKDLIAALKAQTEVPKRTAKATVHCTFCGKAGHVISRCFKKREQEKSNPAVPGSAGVPGPQTLSNSGNASPPS